MLERKLDSFLDSFFEGEHTKALLLTGARQVGKTWAVRNLAKRRFKHFVEINFVETPDAKDIFLGAQNAQQILLRLSAFIQDPLVVGKTLILFDEVQECPEIVTQIKFLVDEGSYRYALSGSLLGVELKDLRSEPVGYMDVVDVFPFDLEEFCTAVGVSDKVIGELHEAYENRRPVDDVVHKQMMSIVSLYLIVGGMPAAVNAYVRTKNMQKVIAEQRAIINLYKRDISRYDPDEKLYLNDIFDLIPSELNNKNKRFILKNLNENFKLSRYQNSFIWMWKAGVAIPTFNVSEPTSPLILNKQRNLFKLFQNDVGLLAYQYSNGIQMEILKGNINVNFGSVYENFVAQELSSKGYPTFYFNSKKLGELDFVIDNGNGEIIPIEVKSGKDYYVHSALDNVLDVQNYDLKQAFVFCNENLKEEDRVLNIPIYMIMFLKKSEVSIEEFRLDISALLD
ncbi:MAG: ATP-binding protein [Bacteroidales bacterium]|nr:ATP-binding protein [Bacteroidales bacterium]